VPSKIRPALAAKWPGAQATGRRVQMATLTEAKEDKDIRDKVGTAGLVPLLVQLLDIDEELVVLHVCRTLFHLARSKV
jgi:hypothetical protein